MTTPRWRSSSWSEAASASIDDRLTAAAAAVHPEVGRGGGGLPSAEPPLPGRPEPSAEAAPGRSTGTGGSIQRIALCLQYDGAAFHGWQRQHGRPSVQQVLEEAIAGLDPHRPLRTVAAGRTDTGVHAAGQVVHFDAAGPIPARRWARALNGRLPQTIRVRAAEAVPAGWHACFSALHRRYRYTILNARTPNLFLAPWSWHRYQVRLDEELMASTLTQLLGEHDFGAFQRAGSRRPHARTTLQEVSLRREGDLVVAELQASGFLYGMVRLLMGQLVAVGEGRLAAAEFLERWRSRDRAAVKEAAPPQGLCLLRVGYPVNPFPRAAWYDGQPQFRLAISDSPLPWSADQGVKDRPVNPSVEPVQR